MRVIWLAPLIAVFGCAHQESTSAEATQPPVAEATAPPPAATPAATPTESEEIATIEKDKPKELACAPVKVHFALDSDQLYDSEKPLLDVTAQCLSSNEKQRVTIVGNADERGPTEYNQDLGQRRANRVALYLQQKGAAPSQVEAVISHGEESPICPESNLKCWQLNRRTAVRQSCHM
jgi:outer membrane protein OmpA-like peptidoglycan-associated protein